MRFLRRSLTGLFLVSLTLGLLVWAGYSLTSSIKTRLADEARPGQVRERVFGVNIVGITPETIAPVLEAFGEIRSRRTLELRAASGGTVIELADGYEEGGQVAAGTVVARVDPTDAESALRVSRAELAEAQAALRDAERTLEIARDDLANAQDQAALRAQALERQKSLQARNLAAEATVETAALAESAARQAVLSKRQAEANAAAAQDSARNAVLRAEINTQEAERALRETTIVAEFSGSLSNVSAALGALVTTNEQIATLVDPEDLEVSFRISTQQYANLLDENGKLTHADVRVSLDLAGVDIVATGRISRESGSVGAGQTGRLIFARLDAAGGFRPGDFVTVEVAEPPLLNVARLPATAVDAGGTVLALTADDRLEQIAVQVLRRQQDDVLIAVADLAGREVVAERTPLLGAGLKVRPARRGAAPEAAAAPEMLELTPERRAALIAFVEGNTRMPADIKTRVLAELNKERVNASTVARIEERMGG